MGTGTDSIGVDISKRIKPEGIEKGIPKELSAKQSDELIKKGMSPDCVKKCEFQDGIIKLKTQNEKLDKSVHPESGVPYRKKVVDLFGTKIEGVFPKFDAVYKTKLPDELFLASDTKQFDYCISQLQKEISKNPELKEAEPLTVTDLSQQVPSEVGLL